MLVATIAVGGFIGVPAMIYLFGMPAIMASATVMGLVGTVFYALEGVVDIRLAMLILLGSIFGAQLGAIGTTFVKDYQVKLVMATIMLIARFSRFFCIPGYLTELGMIEPVHKGLLKMLRHSARHRPVARRDHRSHVPDQRNTRTQGYTDPPPSVGVQD